MVFHIASPFKMGSSNPQKELVEPAVNGTKNVLETANQTDSVERIKSVRELGMTYRPLEATMGDFFAQMIDEGVLKRP